MYGYYISLINRSPTAEGNQNMNSADSNESR